MIMEDKNMSINVSGGIVSIANDSSILNIEQNNYNNGVNASELDNIIKGIMENLSGLKKEDADEIVDAVEMAKEELAKQEPKTSRLRNCVSLIAPMLTIANGIPALIKNLQKFVDYITLYIK